MLSFGEDLEWVFKSLKPTHLLGLCIFLRASVRNTLTIASSVLLLMRYLFLALQVL